MYKIKWEPISDNWHFRAKGMAIYIFEDSDSSVSLEFLGEQRIVFDYIYQAKEHAQKLLNEFQDNLNK